jgi:hypothetical protein
MEIESNPTTSVSNSNKLVDKLAEEDMFSGKNLLVIILLTLLILSFIGINLLSVSGNLLNELAKIFGPTFTNLASMFGYSTGELINNTADVAADATKLGVDIAEGTAQDIGNLLKAASQGGMDEKQKKELDRLLNSPNCPSSVKNALEKHHGAKKDDAEPTKSDSAIQQPIASQKSKAGWCFVGDYDGTRGCVELDEHDKCMSGQIFPSQKMCLNPAYTANMP